MGHFLVGRAAIFFTMMVLSIANYYSLDADFSMPFLVGGAITDIMAVMCFIVFWCAADRSVASHHTLVNADYYAITMRLLCDYYVITM